MFTYILISVVALAILLIASDKFINAAEKIGLSLGVSPFIIGVTIVAFGTSLPELATSIAAVYSNTSEIVAGNVVGSNITNILLVLGLTAIVGKEIKLNFNIWEIDMSMLLASAFLLFLALRDSTFSFFEAIIFLLALGTFLFNTVKGSKSDKEERPKAHVKDYFSMLIGGAVVYFAADYTIFGIKKIAELAMIDPDVISLAFVALGTSLPEVVVSVQATLRGKHAIAVGNVLGSNIFNSFAVMAIPSFLGPLTITDSILTLGLPYMLVATIMFGVMTISHKISKWEGILLVLLYLCYLSELYNAV